MAKTMISKLKTCTGSAWCMNYHITVFRTGLWSNHHLQLKYETFKLPKLPCYHDFSPATNIFLKINNIHQISTEKTYGLWVTAMVKCKSLRNEICFLQMEVQTYACHVFIISSEKLQILNKGKGVKISRQ